MKKLKQSLGTWIEHKSTGRRYALRKLEKFWGVMPPTSGKWGICNTYATCIYNCDLNATYNIGTRYFIREIIKTFSATKRQRLLAKVPEAVYRSTCTLSALISLDAELHAEA